MRDTAKASSAGPDSIEFSDSGQRLLINVLIGAAAFLLMGLLLSLANFASADPLAKITPYKGLSGEAVVTNMASGPDGNVWFVERKHGATNTAYGWITPSGTPKEHALASTDNLAGLTAGPSGEKYLWVADRGTTRAICRIDSAAPEAGQECFTSGLHSGSEPVGIVAGPDGNLWFTERGTTKDIGKIDPVTQEIKYCEKALNAGASPTGIVAGPDGNLWFVDGGTTKAVGRVNPSTCEVIEFGLGENAEPGAAGSAEGPWGIAPGPDGNVWFNVAGSNPEIGNSICRIKTSGEFKCFKKGLIGPLSALTAAPDGKLWFSDPNSKNEGQELEIAGTGLGGTYKLGFEGKETGWSGSGDVSRATGTGDVVRFPTSGTLTCVRTLGSNELKSCGAGLLAGAEVGMRISSLGLDTKTRIEKVEGGVIYTTIPATNSGTSNTTEGWIKNVTTSTGKFEVGQLLTSSSSSPSESEIIAVGAGTITTAAVPAIAGIATGASLTAVSKEIKNVTTTTGCPVKGEEISGTGIPAGTTIAANPSSCEPTSLSISKFPTEAATGASLSVDLPYNAHGTEVVQKALEKLSTIGASNIEGSGANLSSPIIREFKFPGKFAATNVPMLTCNTAGLTGTGVTCTVKETQAAAEGAIDSIDPLTPEEGVTRYPDKAFAQGLGAAVFGPDDNVWFSVGLASTQELGKFGIGDKYALQVAEVGTGSGTVTSSPAGINCGGDCEESYYEYEEVTLTATADEGSEFTGWSGAGCSGTGTCKVTTNEAKEVTAGFKKLGPTNRRTLTLKKSAGGTGGTGTVTSKPKGINCGTACNEAIASMFENSTVVLKAKAATGSTIASWTGCESSTGVGGIEGTCTVAMSEDKEVKVAWSGTSKAIASPTALTVSKGESENNRGFGTVKAAGLYCEAECTTTTVLYQGTVTEPKPKAAKTVELSQAPLYGSEFTGWSGCDSESEGKCIVTMSSAKEVTAEYVAKPNVALTLEKAGTGTGTVTSKPKGMKCAVTCTTQEMAVPSGEAVVLKAKAALGMTFTGWSGGGCSGAAETCTVNPSSATTVTATFSGAPKPIASPTALTLSKEGSGTVKAAGLTCEALCTSATSLYQGTVTEPKPKEAKIVILVATSAPGYQTVVWSGCDSEPEGNCQVQMSSAKEVTATFEELE